MVGVVDRRISLWAWYKGQEYRGSLLKDGLISFMRERHDSPSAAGRAAIGRTCNGWAFWHYRNEKGEWVALRELRR